ncbi:ABC transporter permease [Cellulomonas humilata]|uniref:Autoinducer 2 import system permease protein LsrC n=1 Tax=Cellulomonas humilata TaxID=144055 RepID=A0A7Y6DVY0_9CELL|nr:ABC transporter permease [Cellulomonas humilata]NUU15998.1 ABC transporter permease [Cellulomonas humilata]
MIGRLLRRRETSIALALVLVIVVATAKNDSFLLSTDGFRDLLLAPSLLVLLAVGQAAVIITRNVDLSVSSTLGLVAFATGSMFVAGLPVPVVIVLGIGLGAVLGAVNGVLVTSARVPSLVITLGTLYAFRGITVIWAGSDRINAGDMPRSFLALGTARWGGIPVLAIVALLVVVGVGVYLGYARSGREFYAIGSEPDAALLSGLSVGRRVFFAFVLSGTLAGLAGVLFAARYATIASNAGTGLELQAVAAAVIGGVAIFGGSGTVAGAALGAILLATIDRALPILGIPDFWQQAVVGVLIIGAIVLDRVLALRTARRLRSTGVAEIVRPLPPERVIAS